MVGVTDDDRLRGEVLVCTLEQILLCDQAGVGERAVPERGHGVAVVGRDSIDRGVVIAERRPIVGGAVDAERIAQEGLRSDELRGHGGRGDLRQRRVVPGVVAELNPPAVDQGRSAFLWMVHES